MKAFFYDEKEEELRVKCIRPYLRGVQQRVRFIGRE